MDTSQRKTWFENEIEPVLYEAEYRAGMYGEDCLKKLLEQIRTKLLESFLHPSAEESMAIGVEVQVPKKEKME